MPPGLIRFREPLCPRLGRNLEGAAQRGLPRLAAQAGAGVSPKVKPGALYVHTPGPWFETPTEDRLYRRLGLDLVGKTAGPEYRLARMYGMCLGILSIVVNPAEGLGEFEHADLRAIYRRCGPAMARIVIEALAEAAAEPDAPRAVTAPTSAAGRSSGSSPLTPAMEETATMASHRTLLPLALSLLLGLGWGLGWTAPPPAAAQTEVRTQLGWLRNGEFAPVMVAEAKGFFTEEGIRSPHHGRRPGQEPRAHRGGGTGDLRDHGRRQQRLPGPAREGPRGRRGGGNAPPAGPVQLHHPGESRRP